MTGLMDLYHIAEQRGIEVDCFDLQKREAISMMDADGECFIAINPLKLLSTQDEREKLAHELGHCCTGSFYNQYAGCDIRQKHENRADKWAISRLIGKDALDAAVSAGHTEIWDLAELFGVTEDFMRKAVCWYKSGNLAVDKYF